MGAASPGLQGRPADHTTGQMVAPNDCSLCHTTANWNSTALPAGHMPNPANQACTVCHTASPTNYTTATLAANAVLHTGITQRLRPVPRRHDGADLVQQLHAEGRACSRRRTFRTSSGTDCGSCHSSTTYAAGGSAR